MSRRSAGFTLIELMVVITIIGILVAIALPNYVGATNRAKLASVKSNAHTFQTMLETYSTDFKNNYPGTVAALMTEAQTGGYFKSLTNPFDETKPAAVDFNGSFSTGGQVGYDMHDSFMLRYFIYGGDVLGRQIQMNGAQLCLSNS